jgi:hypothetical protein
LVEISAAPQLIRNLFVIGCKLLKNRRFLLSIGGVELRSSGLWNNGEKNDINDAKRIFKTNQPMYW